MTKKISIIVPCFNEQETIPLFYQAVNALIPQLRDYTLEYIFIDDGSSDNTLLELQNLNEDNPQNVHFVSFSRNFGKEAALYAGLQTATGDLVAVMDVDLQDPPEQLPLMLSGILDEGYEIVGTRRVNRKGEPPIRSFFSILFYKLMSKISDVPMIQGVRDYRLMTRKVVDSILKMSEYNRFSKGIFNWIGFKTKYLEYENRDRVAGNTSWSFWKLFRYSIEGIVNFSEVPLLIASFAGFFTFALSILFMLFIIARKIFYGGSVNGWASLVTIIVGLGGVQLFCLGIVGKYIGNIYLEVKNRPLYIVKEKK
ncbi:MAG: glycosyltransferase family 2 protein [Liquorilactobacillus hordei]|uniref:Glycosyltransferase n=2 Tax=Liquorilactobacillus hordei TaxID=468911 RepID=A0A3Q8CK70_9LACO|nr:glycosyltransferase family 2 protein [Liquorilactobacillus hordei]AUJ29659.1 glycosyltransferase [Liquorilactobacillus hordei]MBZ2405093.1 glycosyltransferase [Liquorilactobacillus hordei]